MGGEQLQDRLLALVRRHKDSTYLPKTEKRATVALAPTRVPTACCKRAYAKDNRHVRSVKRLLLKRTCRRMNQACSNDNHRTVSQSRDVVVLTSNKLLTTKK